MKELFKISTDQSDDLEFISLVNRLISSTFKERSYESVHIIKINNWFDHKWLKYSGKEAVLFESDGLVNNDLSLDEKWKKQITFPPFNPNRVLSSKTYPINREVRTNDTEPIHKFQVSGENLQNRVVLKQENSIYAWFSSNSGINKRGSLMIYELFNKEVETWYCQIELKEKWQIGKSKNVSRVKLIEMIK